MNFLIDNQFPGLRTRHLTECITWTFAKHWGQGYLAGEGITNINGDYSGGLRMIEDLPYTNAPCVAQARVYRGPRGWVSAVYSYPNGIGAVSRYFWEIYTPDQTLMDECERFTEEEAMEHRIVEILEGPHHVP